MRQEIANRYSGALKNQFHVPNVPVGYISSWAQYTLRTKAGMREAYMEKLKSAGIPSAIYYGKGMHEQTAFNTLGYKKGDYPVAEGMSSTVFSLPMHSYLDETDQQQIIAALLA